MRLLRFLAPVVVCVATLLAAAQDGWTAPARELVRRVVERAGKPSSIALAVKNASALPDAEAAKIQRILEAQFREFGVELLEPARAVAEIRVTLSENAQGHLWTAEVRQGQQRETVMLGFERSAARSGAEETFTVTLRRLLLLESQEPILDVAKLDLAGQPALLVLHGSRLALYRPSAEGWQQDASLYLRTERSLPRDLRGRLVANKSLNFDAYLPGTKCSGSAVARLGAECKSSDDPWPLTADARVNGFVNPARNFFNALSVRTGNPAMNVLPFFSVAASERMPWVFAGADGIARVYDQRPDPIAQLRGWGSDVVAIDSGCGAGAQVLAGAAGDATVSDALQAFEFRDGAAVAASARMTFGGPITALWPSTIDERGALAVVRNLTTGKHEAFLLTLACQ